MLDPSLFSFRSLLLFCAIDITHTYVQLGFDSWTQRFQCRKMNQAVVAHGRNGAQKRLWIYCAASMVAVAAAFTLMDVLLPLRIGKSCTSL